MPTQSYQHFTEQSASDLYDAVYQGEQQATDLSTEFGSLSGTFTPSMTLDQASGDFQHPTAYVGWLDEAFHAPSSTETLQQTMQFGLASFLPSFDSGMPAYEPSPNIQDNNGLRNVETLYPNGPVVEFRHIPKGWRSYPLPAFPLIKFNVQTFILHTNLTQDLEEQHGRYQEWIRNFEGFIRQIKALRNIRQLYWATSFVQLEDHLFFELFAPDNEYVRQWVQKAIDNADSDLAVAHPDESLVTESPVRVPQYVVTEAQQDIDENIGDIQLPNTVLEGPGIVETPASPFPNTPTPVKQEGHFIPSSPSTLGPESPLHYHGGSVHDENGDLFFGGMSYPMRYQQSPAEKSGHATEEEDST